MVFNCNVFSIFLYQFTKLACDKKPILLISPNVKVATESKKSKKPTTSTPDSRKKSLIDSGIEMIFKKHHHVNKSALGSGSSGIRSGSSGGIDEFFSSHSAFNSSAADLKFRPDLILDSSKDSNTGRSGSISAVLSSSSSTIIGDEKKTWKPFESIKIYTERRRSHDVTPTATSSIPSVPGSDSKKYSHFTSFEKYFYSMICHCIFVVVLLSEPISLGEECSTSRIRLTSDASLLDEHGSPKKTKKTMLSGNKQIDQLLHTFIDYILRDYIDSWFCSISDNKEFSEFRTRNCIEESLQNFCNRIKNTLWLPLMTTKLVDNMATHSRLYRLATQAQAANANECKTTAKQRNSPQKRMKKEQHRRNKSDTDLSWYLGNSGTAAAAVASTQHKNVANSKFYTTSQPVDESTLIDPEAKLLNTFFDTCDLYKNECLSEAALESKFYYLIFLKYFFF